MTSIAIVGMACQYPDARSPAELWENVLAQRRAFRRIPPERLRLEDYYSEDRQASDYIYITQAAVLKDYEFDRVKFRVAGTTYRQSDLTHWLALDVAARALADAGFSEGEGLGRETTGVILGNTLTGEFSRASLMRLRWPYVRRVVEAGLSEQGWSAEQRREFLLNLETQYKAPFPPIGEETLAGGLSNTIAGRICNYFDLKGGGYTVDGACASSLLAITTACSALAAGDLDVALAGGVDLSLDPFELVGFARTSALAPEKMRVYDRRSAGFWPGEGCGFVVLMRYEDAIAQQRQIYALIRGWGVSSDGSGGITRPELEGQILAVRRAYQRAGFGVETVTYFEGHGTGTAVGDATELRTLSQARREAALAAPPAVIGSIKANIGHTKAAAGVAGLIKTTLALHHQILPPNTGSEEPHPELTGAAPALQVLSEAQPWPADRPLRAGVSAMGFGGINTHIVLEGTANRRRSKTFDTREKLLLSSGQDAELFLLSGQDVAGLQQQVAQLLTLAAKLSLAELTDLTAQLQRNLTKNLVRAAIVAATPAELVQRLETLQTWLEEGVTRRLDLHLGLFLGSGLSAPRLGYLFPGQGTRVYLDGGVLAHRFPFIPELYAQADLPQNGYQGVETGVAQPAIVTASLAALRVLDWLGFKATVAVGHSLGELTALHWAGAMDEVLLLRLAQVRGQAMMELGNPTGTMANIRAGYETVQSLLNGEAVTIACLNTPHQTVISGPTTDVATVVARAQAQGLDARQIAVSHAFHSPLVEAAARPLADYLASQTFQPLQQKIISTVTGAPLPAETDLRHLLFQQVTAPVRFAEAAFQAANGVDLLIEVGPGRILSSMVEDFIDLPTIALDAGSPSLKGLLQAVGAAFALGAPLNLEVLFADRFNRPFDLDRQPNFLANPCELAPLPEESSAGVRNTQPVELASKGEQGLTGQASNGFDVHSPETHHVSKQQDILGLVRQLIASRVELPLAAVGNDDRLLSDLHLNSITVTQIVAEAARQLEIPVPVAPTEFANVTVTDVAQTLEEMARNGGLAANQEKLPPGVDSWIRSFSVEWVEQPAPRRQIVTGLGPWQVIIPPDYVLAEAIRQTFAQIDGGSVVVCLPPEPDECHLTVLLRAAQAAFSLKEPSRFVLLQHGGGGAAFGRTLHLEAPEIATCVVDVPVDHPQATEWIKTEALAAALGYTEARYDAEGRRWAPVLRLLPLDGEPGPLPLGPDDVLLVTGGGKGITAECALSLARETGARLALLGRSQPETEAELLANLERMVEAGIKFRYIVADVTDSEAVQAAVREVETTLGPVTGILHGAARNVPQLLRNLDEESFRRTLAPKVQGARNLLAAINPDQLRLFVSFGSIIARTGLPGEADYGLANEWLARLTERFQQEHPACRCLTIEWSVWAGTGMGERLGTLDRLVKQGIIPIPLDEGVMMLHRLIGQVASLPPAVVVTSRFGTPPTLRVEQPELPFWRFLEKVQVFYPGVELIVEATLSGETDPYLADHVFQGERLFLAVLGLEAMAQVAMALAQTNETPIFADVQLKRPIVVPEAASTTIRVAALRRETGEVEVVLRSQETAFQVDHFRATCHFGDLSGFPGPATRSAGKNLLDLIPDQFPPLYLDPNQELYEKLFFHKGRFRRVKGYRQVMAQQMVAELTPADQEPWFSRYLPPDLVLGDPGARDATIHAIQVCVPQATLLPISVERIVPGNAKIAGPRYVRARERANEAEADTVVFDVVVTDSDGGVQEEWQGLRLKMMNGTTFTGPWSPPVLGPYLERRLRDLWPGSALSIIVQRDLDRDRRSRSNLAIRRALGEMVSVQRRLDGKPEVVGDRVVSVAHTADLTLAVAASKEDGPIGCDLEPVVARSASEWQDLLGQERFKLAEVVTKAANEGQDIAATRVWAAGECLKKAGAAIDTPLTLASVNGDGWILLAAGSLITATLATQVQDSPDPLVLAVLTRGS